MKLKPVTLLFAIALALVPLGVYAYCYPQLPAQIVTTYDFSGNPQGYTNKDSMWTLLMLPFVFLVLFILIPRIDPRGKNYEKLGAFYPAFILVMTGFLSLMQSLIFINSLPNMNVPIETVVCIAVGLVFVLLGNYMPKMKQSYTMGIKNPWTLESEVVWNKTHRLAGPCFMVAGLVIILSVALPSKWTFVLVVSSCALAALVPSIMSYVYYKREQST